MSKRGTIRAVCISTEKGTRKRPVESGLLIEDHGLQGDAHAGVRRRQVSLLCRSSIETMSQKGAEVGPGDFAENLTVDGLEPDDFPVGATIRLEGGPVLEVTQIGKKCHSECEIARQVGTCVMPKEGLFGRVIEGGRVEPGDCIEVSENEDQFRDSGGQ